MSGGISRSRSSTAAASVSSDCLPSGLRSALPSSNRTEEFEHEPVADHLDVGPRAEDLPQPPEEVGAVAVELLHLLRERDIEPLAEIGDLRLRFPVRGLRRRERILDRGELLA